MFACRGAKTAATTAKSEEQKVVAKPTKVVEMKLVDNVIRSMRVGKVFKENQDPVNHLHFSADGASLITSADDDQVVIYDCERGSKGRTLNSKKYGVDLVHFTSNKSNVVHASTKENDIIRYLNVTQNKYISYFRGHSKRVVTLCMSPTDESFLSGSLDKTIRLWDLRSANCQGLMHLAGRPVAAFDPEGLIFAAGINSESVKLYDLRSFDKGPFSSFKFTRKHYLSLIKLSVTMPCCRLVVTSSCRFQVSTLFFQPRKTSTGRGSSSVPTERPSSSRRTGRSSG